MRGDKIEPRVDQGVAQVRLAQIVPAERGRDQPIWIEPTDQVPQPLQLVHRHEPRVADVALVRQVEIPVAVLLQRFDQRLDGATVRLEIRDRPALGPVAARERHIHHHPPAIALGHQRPQPSQEGLAGSSLGVHRRDIVIERGPGRPDAQPVEPVALQVVEVSADELLRAPRAP